MPLDPARLTFLFVLFENLGILTSYFPSMGREPWTSPVRLWPATSRMLFRVSIPHWPRAASSFKGMATSSRTWSSEEMLSMRLHAHWFGWPSPGQSPRECVALGMDKELPVGYWVVDTAAATVKMKSRKNHYLLFFSQNPYILLTQLLLIEFNVFILHTISVAFCYIFLLFLFKCLICYIYLWQISIILLFLI